jgi:hypothetical protein
MSKARTPSSNFRRLKWSLTGLPDGLFSNQKYQFGQILEGLAMEVVAIFYVHLAFSTAIWYIFVIWYILW